ncbi:MAG TPA: NfeD family protein [Burkholderiales bacterium]|nr:NfeD family protein [Burkholderiales bacterium]
MADYILWAAAGLILVIAELVTGTFYLLVLGIAALAGAVVAFFGLGFWGQAVVSAVIAVVGVIWIHQRRKAMEPTAMPSPDVGQPVTWESWLNEPDRLARVRYRGASWEARVVGECTAQPGEMLYISAVNGNTLEVAKIRPA